MSQQSDRFTAACAALQGLISNSSITQRADVATDEDAADDIAWNVETAINYADELLKQLNKKS